MKIFVLLDKKDASLTITTCTAYLGWVYVKSGRKAWWVSGDILMKEFELLGEL